jgi:hypothetical protein
MEMKKKLTIKREAIKDDHRGRKAITTTQGTTPAKRDPVPLALLLETYKYKHGAA